MEVVRKVGAQAVRVTSSSRLSGIIWVVARRLFELAVQVGKFGPRPPKLERCVPLCEGGEEFSGRRGAK